ncbi:MAG: DEAD/DEAH box helicase, partial [Caldisphaeraceae archaeon]|nr:DEAD/DEAH box helicase [Caldisphaeraceae archaeon]
MKLEYPFTLFHEKLQRCMLRKIKTPTNIQSLAVPAILEGKNVLLTAPTASGKTEAAILPIIDIIIRKYWDVEGVKLIYINPLKALTRDLRDRIEYYAQCTGLKVRPLYGDVVKTYR